jgi:hypothetical protein
LEGALLAVARFAAMEDTQDNDVVGLDTVLQDIRGAKNMQHDLTVLGASADWMFKLPVIPNP